MELNKFIKQINFDFQKMIILIEYYEKLLFDGISCDNIELILQMDIDAFLEGNRSIIKSGDDIELFKRALQLAYESFENKIKSKEYNSLRLINKNTTLD